MTASEVYETSKVWFPPPAAATTSFHDLLGVPKESGVYFIYEEGVCVYVGSSLDMRKRLQGHEHIAGNRRVGYLLCDRNMRRRFEAFYIGLLGPHLNSECRSEELDHARGLTRKRTRCTRSCLARRIHALLENLGDLSLSDIHRACGYGNRASLLRSVLSSLEQWLLIESVTVATAGRPRTVFRIRGSTTEAIA